MQFSQLYVWNNPWQFDMLKKSIVLLNYLGDPKMIHLINFHRNNNGYMKTIEQVFSYQISFLPIVTSIDDTFSKGRSESPHVGSGETKYHRW